MATASRVALNSRHLMSANLSVQTSSRKKLLALQSVRLKRIPKRTKMLRKQAVIQVNVSLASPAGKLMSLNVT